MHTVAASQHLCLSHLTRREYSRSVLRAVSCAFRRIEARLVGGFGTSLGNIRILVDHGAVCLALEAVCEASVSTISANILSRDFCE
jgi:hypothetical protein